MNVKLNPNNPRQISKVKDEKLKRSLSECIKMLEIRPIAYDEEGIIWGGNMRFRALQELVREGLLEDRPEYYKELTGFTYEEKRRFAIEDNVEFGDWDMDILGNEWDDLPLDDWGVDVGVWDKEVEEDEVPEVSASEPISRYGEVYKLGKHRLMCGDSTRIEDVEKLMNGQKADMVFTDPPYGVDYQSNMRVKTKKFDVLENDGVILSDWVSPSIMFSTGWVLFCTTWKMLSEWLEVGKQIGDLSNMIIWDKGGGGIGDLTHSLSTDYEIILAYNRGNTIHGKRIGSVWSIAKDGSTSYKHPTQKPIELPALAIRTFSTGSVLDLFGGSGSTLIACEQLDRTCYMMELDPKYCDVIRKRYHRFVNGTEDGWDS